MRLADPDAQKRLLDAVAGGVPLTHAATYAGVSDRTLWRLMVRGEVALERRESGHRLTDPRDVEAVELFEKLRRARASVSVRNVSLIQKAATGGHVRKETMRRYRNDEGDLVEEVEREYADIDWRAAKWLLEKSFAKEFGPSAVPIELTGMGGEQVQVSTSEVVSKLSERMALVVAQRAEDAVRDEDEVIDVEVVEE